MTDRTKIDYAKAVLRRRYAVGDLLNNGAQLEADKFYQIVRYGAGDDFSNVGVPAGLAMSGLAFKATGTDPTAWTNGSRLQQFDVPALRGYASQVFEPATKNIILKSVSYEGGSASGEIGFEELFRGLALEELLAELDPDYIASAPLPRREIGVTVRLGC